MIRRARRDEAGILSALALRSKAYWGYPPGFLERCRRELTILPHEIDRSAFFVSEEDGAIGGFYGLRATGTRVTLDYLYVDPATIGRGIGTRLWDHALSEARTTGAAEITIEADPNGEPFYLSRGARRIGEAPSGSIPGRSLPLLAFALDRHRA